MTGARATIEITVRPAPTAYLFVFPLFFRPVVSVDGTRVDGVRWGRPLAVPVRAGRHRVEIWSVGQVEVQVLDVEVTAGEVARISYRSPLARAGRGRIDAVEGTRVFDEVYGFSVGQRVSHPKWGPGEITRFDTEAERDLITAARAVVAFDDGQERTIDLDREDLFTS